MIIEATIIIITALLVWWLVRKDDRNDLIRNLREFEQKDIMDKKDKK
tara:strand:- start:495 stop:635 length:141 start_codon:yes stop_codon:yes gene_type:complete